MEAVDPLATRPATPAAVSTELPLPWTLRLLPRQLQLLKQLARMKFPKFYLLWSMAPSRPPEVLVQAQLTQPKESTIVRVLFLPMSTLNGPRQTLWTVRLLV